MKKILWVGENYIDNAEFTGVGIFVECLPVIRPIRSAEDDMNVAFAECFAVGVTGLEDTTRV